MTGLLEVEPEIVHIKDELVLLNRYYIETRYPDDIPEPFFDECEGAFKAALRVKEFVLHRIES